MNLIRYIGDQVSESGELIRQLAEISEEIGAPGEELAKQLIEELCEHGVVNVRTISRALGGLARYRGVSLTLKGWEQYEAEKRGGFDGNYGFLAMQFDEPDLESFVRDVVKPAVKEDIGCDLVDMRDVSKSGIIDNIMRVRIRDAKFVISDLTHGNNGAYWEAGYAEGLGKTVIYITVAESRLNAKYFTTVEGRMGAPGISLISQAESELQSQMNQSMVRKK